MNRPLNYPPLNQYTAIAPDTPALAYDPDGNMTRNGDWTYIWDAENRLIEARPATTNLGAALVQYMYDNQSRRIARREFVWSDYLGDTTWHYVQGRAYLYDGWNLLQERKPPFIPRTPPTYIPQTNLSLTGHSGHIAASYLWGLDLSQTLQGAGGVGGLLQSSFSATNAFTFCDANGNITEILDDTATLFAHYEYDSYGNTILQTGPNSDAFPFRFSTKHYDNGTELYYYGFRYYSPTNSIWLTRDNTEECDTPNLYLFIHNNPANSLDFLGLTTVGEILDAFFSAQTDERLWIMGPDDEYTQHVRNWGEVQSVVEQAKNSIPIDCTEWQSRHQTSLTWKPGRTDPPQADSAAWDSWVDFPDGTDPKTAKKAFISYLMTGIQPNELWTSAIGSFGIYITVDAIDCECKTATLHIWMYNSMDVDSFGRYAKLFPLSGMARQYMWWNWTEEYSWGAEKRQHDRTNRNREGKKRW